MKTILLAISVSLVTMTAYAQRETPKEIAINIPNFANAGVKSFYKTYSDHLLKCVKAIHEKNEFQATTLFKDPGQQLVAKEKVIVKELMKDPAEKQKYILLATQLYPYVKEIQQSAYYKKLYGH